MPSAADATDLSRTHDAFNDLVAELDHCMLVVTVQAGEERAGCLVGFHTQCSIEPPRYAVWLSKANRTYHVALGAETLALHFLGADNEKLAALFGTVTGDATDKFQRCAWSPGPDGVPLLDDCDAIVIARRGALVDDGTSDHVCIVLSPTEVRAPRTALDRLMFSAVHDLEAGHAATEHSQDAPVV
jgi:flavin reductase (DIM6/NTAB) family NADH-FMN oxidoreductase RutF